MVLSWWQWSIVLPILILISSFIVIILAYVCIATMRQVERKNRRRRLIHTSPLVKVIFKVGPTFVDQEASDNDISSLDAHFSCGGIDPVCYDLLVKVPAGDADSQPRQNNSRNQDVIFHISVEKEIYDSVETGQLIHNPLYKAAGSMVVDAGGNTAAFH